jgi:hypothetical protein
VSAENVQANTVLNKVNTMATKPSAADSKLVGLHLKLKRMGRYMLLSGIVNIFLMVCLCLMSFSADRISAFMLGFVWLGSVISCQLSTYFQIAAVKVSIRKAEIVNS